MISRKFVLPFLALSLAVASAAKATPFTFGVISDTQDTIGTGTNTVATNIIAAVNQQFVAKGVSFVLQPGDLGDDGSVASLTARLSANSALTTAGIPFYGLRGNHEDNSAAQTYFNANYIPAGAAIAPDTSSYAITINGTKIVMLDILTADTPAAMTSATTWMQGQLSAADHTQAFVLQHKDLLGQNHKDNAFGSGNDANPTQQNAFFAALASNNVKYDISGHDHMNHRSIVTSPDGLNKVQEIISQSDSTKFYTASSGFSTREASVSDQQNQIGYYTYTVDGPRVTGKYYATAPAANGDIPANATWSLQDTFGYSLNGKQFTIARGAGYSSVSDAISSGTVQGETFDFATSMALAGTNSNTGTAEGSRAEVDDVNTGWTPATVGMASNILTLWGMNNALGADTTDPYTLTLSYVPGTARPGIEHQNSDGSWTLLGGADDGLGNVTVSNLTYVGNFAVVAVPEPASMAILALGGLALIAHRRRTA